MKKILHIISSLHWRGGEKQVNYLFTHPSTNFENFLFCAKGSELEKRNPDNLRLFAFKRRSGMAIAMGLKLKSVCSKNKINLIHIHDSHSLNGYIVATMIGLKIPAIVHRHVNFKITNSWKYTFSGIKKIICVSESVKSNFREIVEENKLVVIHPAINTNTTIKTDNHNDLKKELRLHEDINLIGTIAALEKEKNIEEFIDIAKALLKNNKNLCFTIFGDGKEKKMLEKKIKEEGVEKNVLLLGFRNTIQKDITGLDLFLFTSKNEGFPLVLLEAMVGRVPIVTTSSGGIKDMVCNEINGVIYNQGNKGDAVLKIEALLNDNYKCDTIKNKAFDYVQQFDVPLMLKKIEATYNEIIN